MSLRALAFAASGALFGAGLWLSGMTDTAKVKGFLDIFGAWDPTLAFVMGGAVLPMTLAWRVAARRRSPALGGGFPIRPPLRFDPGLTLGSVLFGVGWGLVGLCPGPVIAALSYGGWPLWLFALAMLAGMAAAPRVAVRLDSGRARA